MYSSLLRKSKRPSSTSSTPLNRGWQAEYQAARITVGDLLESLDLDPSGLPFDVDDRPDFPIRIPPHFLSLIEKGNATDPLLLQVLARADERVQRLGDTFDPLEEAGRFDEAGVLRKYRGRVLLLVSGACAIHCRYCFRRHYDYGDHVVSSAALDRALDRLACDPSVEEVILSGGDPLSLTDQKLGHILRRIDGFASVRTIRIHSRTIAAVPSRVTAELVQMLGSTAKPVTVVMHTNHTNELCEVVEGRMRELRAAGIVLLNQSVLLRGINDDAATLRAHCYRLLECGVLPYYIHMLDPVAGANHFAVGDEIALDLERELRASLPGFLVPRFVREVPGAPSKLPIAGSAAPDQRRLQEQ